jgi:leucyl aminopeptidase (aminopeptidase T)
VRLAFPNRFHDLVAAGLPILTSRIQDIQKAVTENRLGVVLAGSDSKSIAEGIVECAANRESYRENVLRYREQNVWQNEVAKLLASIDATAQRICVVVKKDVTNHGRTHRMVASLLAAGKDVRVVAPAGNLPIAHPKLGVILVRDGLLNKG